MAKSGRQLILSTSSTGSYVRCSKLVVVGIMRLLLPPQVDNEKAADYLRLCIGPDDRVIQWVVVRPDTLINKDQVTKYDIHPSPTRSAIFNPGKTSRINVAHFIADLITRDEFWNQWQGKMPVIYNEVL
ncbi:MAG: NAD(P)H-binding protein [Candidatus Bathyarchaeota archaeon]|nr:MAG: NAD(P)H-binding protein [Candidatus Bathyarchaeota archaeon]